MERESQKQWRLANKDKIKAYKLTRREQQKQYCKNWRAKNTERVNATARAYYLRNKHKLKAQSLVNQAIRQNKLIRAQECVQCGKTGETIQAHHEDYSKPFDIIWLCKACHWLIHHGPNFSPKANLK